MRKGTVQKTLFTPQYVRDRLVARAIEAGTLLKGFDPSKVAPVIIEIHRRYHTIVPTPSDIRTAEEGNMCRCAYAVAAVKVNGIYAAAMLRRVSYTLELKDNGKDLGLFKFGTPDQARRRLIKFDKTKNMRQHAVTFAPLPKTRRSDAMRKAIKASQKKHGRKAPLKRRSYWQTLRLALPQDIAA